MELIILRSKFRAQKLKKDVVERESKSKGSVKDVERLKRNLGRPEPDQIPVSIQRGEGRGGMAGQGALRLICCWQAERALCAVDCMLPSAAEASSWHQKWSRGKFSNSRRRGQN